MSGFTVQSGFLSEAIVVCAVIIGTETAFFIAGRVSQPETPLHFWQIEITNTI